MAPGGGVGDSRERWWSCSGDGEVRRRGTMWGLGEDGTCSSGRAEVRAKHPGGSRWRLGLRGWISRRLATTELRVAEDTAAPSCQEDAEGEKGEGGAQGASSVLEMSQLWWEIAGRIRGSRHGWGVCGGGGVGWARPSASQGQGRQWCQSLLSPQCPARGLNVEGPHTTRLGRLGECTNGAPPTSPSSPLVTEWWRAPPSLQGGVSPLCLQPRPTV